MSSIQSSFAQNKTRTFSVLGSTNAWIHDFTNLTGSFVAGSVTNVGSVYTVDTVANFITFVQNVSGAGVGGLYHALVANETLVDFGSEIVVGVAGVSSTLLKFRLVRRTTGTVAATGYTGGSTNATFSVGYVVSENNVSQDIEDSGAITDLLNVKIARV